MRIRILLTFLLVTLGVVSGWAQLFPDRNLYDIWISAEKQLNAGRFTNAIMLYEGRQGIPEFQNRLKTAQSLQALFQVAERLYRAKKYAEALEEFSKYRAIEKNIQIAIFDSRIQSCLQQVEKTLIKKLNENIRIIAGFEWAYTGEQQLSVLDTASAQKSFSKARRLGGNLNATLREQYQAGLRATESLQAWGESYRQALLDNEEDKILAELKAYRSASKYIISDLENEIKTKGEAKLFAQNSNPLVVMARYADDCRTSELLYYAKQKRQVITNADLIIDRISEYRQIEADIELLNKDAGNRVFLESAYRSLMDKGSQIPQVGLAVQLCAKKSYGGYLVNLAIINEKAGDENNVRTNYEEAMRYSVEARQLGLPAYDSTLNALEGRVAVKLGCEGIRRDFERSVLRINRELSNCRVMQAKRLWDEAVAKLKGCDLNDAGFLDQYASLHQSLTLLYAADSTYAWLASRASRANDSRECGEARRLYQQMGTLDVCNTAYRDSAYADNVLRVTECERNSCYAVAYTKANQNMDKKEWKQAYDYYKAASTCATPPQKERIAQLLVSIECEAYPDICRKRGVSLSVEPTFRLSANKPKYTEDGTYKNTTYGYLASGGLQLSFLAYESPLDFVVGAEYFRTEYQSVRTSGGVEYASGEFDISGATAFVALKLHRTNTEPSKIRPYLKGGMEVLLPVAYQFVDFDNVPRSTMNSSLLKKQSLNAMGGIGIELQRKGFGFFAEVTMAYNFSGIYNANAISASGSRGVTESYFRMAGLRVGVRFW